MGPVPGLICWDACAGCLPGAQLMRAILAPGQGPSHPLLYVAGFAGRVAAVQRLLFDQQLQPLLMWMQHAVVEDFGRPDAAAEACWDLMQLGSGHVVAEVSALIIVEGHYGTAAPVARELYRLEQEKPRQVSSGLGSWDGPWPEAQGPVWLGAE